MNSNLLNCIGIFDNNKKPENIPFVENLILNLKSQGYRLIVASGTDHRFSDICYKEKDEIIKEASILLVLGGDGSLLRSARLISSSNLPILGVNFGKLGFLTETNLNQLPEQLAKLQSGSYSLEKRPLLSAIYQGKEILALNEIAIEKGSSPRVIRMEVYINGKYFSTYTSDGLLISTPTGSTAYNLSAGGPIMQPDVRAILLTPLNPHALAMRPFLIPDDVEIKIIARSDQNSMLLSGDGQDSVVLNKESEIIIKKHADQVSFVRFADSDFYKLLRNKLGWGGFCDRK